MYPRGVGISARPAFSVRVRRGQLDPIHFRVNAPFTLMVWLLLGKVPSIEVFSLVLQRIGGSPYSPPSPQSSDTS